jgi:ferredoxin
MEKIEIKFDASSPRVEKVTILQILKKKGVDVHFHCLDGFCGACKCDKPISGDIKYKEGKTPLAFFDTDDEGNETEFLPCISQIDLSKVKPDENGKGTIVFMFDKKVLRYNFKNQTSEFLSKKKESDDTSEINKLEKSPSNISKKR